MIETVNSINSNKYLYNKNLSNIDSPSFSGLGESVLNVAVNAMQKCEAIPMLNVAVADVTTAILPRAIMESQTNAFAGLEAFRRESSGLIINCLIPGVIVANVAKALVKPIMGEKSEMVNCWANSDTIDLITKYWKEAKDVAVDESGKEIFEQGSKAKAYNTIKNLLDNTSGVDGLETKAFKDFKEMDGYARELTETVFKAASKEKASEVGKIYAKMVEKTHISQNIKIAGQNNGGYFSQELDAVVKNAPTMIKELTEGSVKKSDFAEQFAKRAGRLVTSKSLGGLALVLPLAIFAQPFNRWLTEKTSGKKGAPIYKDFDKKGGIVENDKAGLAKQKMISVSSMAGLVALSIFAMKKTKGSVFKNVTQFQSMFPSMNQARIISGVTFSSRMMASQDKNDLREATVRDMATFSAFYFLGDYVAKGVATIIQKVKNVELLNDLNPLAKDEKSILKKIIHWTKDTALKSTDELLEKGQRYRSLCQLSNLGFSLIALGLLIPKINRSKTDKKCEEMKNK